MLGFCIGVTLGCVSGLIAGFFPVGPSGSERKPQAMLSVNQSTGKPQIHIQGKPEIK